MPNFIAPEDIADWTVGQYIAKVDYDTEHHVLALTLGNGEVLLCTTEVIARGLKT